MRNNQIRKMTFTAIMAAMVFVTTMFLKIDIPTPVGPTMLKVANIVCLLSGMLLGGVYGGLAAGIGSALYDLTDARFAASAPFTLIFFFLMGFVCGVVSHSFGSHGRNIFKNAIGAVCGALTYFVVYFTYKTVVLVLAGSTVEAALIAQSTKMAVSAINAGIAVVCSTILITPLNAALTRAGLLR